MFFPLLDIFWKKGNAQYWNFILLITNAHVLLLLEQANSQLCFKFFFSSAFELSTWEFISVQRKKGSVSNPSFYYSGPTPSVKIINGKLIWLYEHFYYELWITSESICLIIFPQLPETFLKGRFSFQTDTHIPIFLNCSYTVTFRLSFCGAETV